MSRFATDNDLLLLKAAIYAETTPEERTFALDESKCMFSRKKWGCHLLRGHLSYVCHMLKGMISQKDVTTPGTPSGEIVSMSEGPISVSFGSSGSTGEKDSWLMTTPEGKEYVSLRRLVGAACGVSVSASRCRPRRGCARG